VRLEVTIPGHARQLVLVQRWSQGAWHDVTKARLDRDAASTVTVRAAGHGEQRYRFVKAPDTTHLGAVSKALRVDVV
jgi:hypothetical protein